LTALIVGLDRRLNLTEDVPRALLTSENLLLKHEGDTDALFLTITKSAAVKIRNRIYKTLMRACDTS